MNAIPNGMLPWHNFPHKPKQPGTCCIAAAALAAVGLFTGGDTTTNNCTHLSPKPSRESQSRGFEAPRTWLKWLIYNVCCQATCTHRPPCCLCNTCVTSKYT
jgi:hypothetical protein